MGLMHVYFKSGPYSKPMGLIMTDAEIIDDFKAYLLNGKQPVKAYKQANDIGEVVLDFREVSAIQSQNH